MRVSAILSSSAGLPSCHRYEISIWAGRSLVLLLRNGDLRNGNCSWVRMTVQSLQSLSNHIWYQYFTHFEMISLQKGKITQETSSIVYETEMMLCHRKDGFLLP